jgi:hypothetical protein
VRSVSSNDAPGTLQERQLEKSFGEDWREVNAALLARPHNKNRLVIRGRLIRTCDGNSDEIFSLITALRSPEWRGSRQTARDWLDHLVAKPKDAVIVPGDGDPCTSCGMPTEIREHVAITKEELTRRTRYFVRWFYCAQCDEVIWPERYAVSNLSGARFNAFADTMSQALGDEYLGGSAQEEREEVQGR